MSVISPRFGGSNRFSLLPRGLFLPLLMASTLRTASEKDPKKATEANILGTLNVLEAARIFGVARVVFASSAAIYGSKAAQDDISEADSATPEDLYGAAKKYI